MTYGFEFHDSRLLEARCEATGEGTLLFHASVYRSQGLVFEDPQVSGFQNVRFRFEGMRVDGSLNKVAEYASDGALWIDGVRHELPLLPVDHRGEVRMELQLSPDFGITTIHATHIVSTFEGEFEPEFQWDAEGNITSIP